MASDTCSSPQCQAASTKLCPLPLVIRFYVYGTQGFCYEILFTAMLEFITTGSIHFKGHSAISSFFIYGTCSLFVERLYVWLYIQRNVPWFFRLPIYLVVIYSWEFTWGSMLRHFDACPWDYSHYRFNVKGLITLEYAPGWLFLCCIQDLVADYMMRLRISEAPAFSFMLGTGVNKFD